MRFQSLIRRSTLALTAFACIGAPLIPTVTFAQTPASPSTPVVGSANSGQFPRGGGGGGMRRKLERLNLTDSQKSQIQDIFRRYKHDHKNPAFKQEIMAVLTPEQREQLHGRRRGGFRRGRGRRMPPATTNTPTATPKPPSF
jgi:Spy/CpxP family protein refolding chaperone